MLGMERLLVLTHNQDTTHTVLPEQRSPTPTENALLVVGLALRVGIQVQEGCRWIREWHLSLQLRVLVVIRPCRVRMQPSGADGRPNKFGNVRRVAFREDIVVARDVDLLELRLLE